MFIPDSRVPPWNQNELRGRSQTMLIAYYWPLQQERVGLNGRTQYLPLFWPVQQRSAAVEHNTVRVADISISHVSLTPYLAEWVDIGEEILILL